MKKTLIFAFMCTAIFLGVAQAQVTIQENFNDESWDTNLWTNTSDNGATANEIGGVLTTSNPSGTSSSAARLSSKVLLVGDFDIQVDFNLIDFNTYWSSASLLVADANNSGNKMLVYIAWLINNTKLYDSTHYSGGNLVGQYNLSTSDSTGKFRIARVGSQITTYYWSNDAWVQLLSETAFTADAQVHITGFKTQHNGKVTVNWDNFNWVSKSIRY